MLLLSPFLAFLTAPLNGADPPPDRSAYSGGSAASCASSSYCGDMKTYSAASYSAESCVAAAAGSTCDSSSNVSVQIVTSSKCGDASKANTQPNWGWALSQTECEAASRAYAGSCVCRAGSSCSSAGHHTEWCYDTGACSDKQAGSGGTWSELACTRPMRWGGISQANYDFPRGCAPRPPAAPTAPRPPAPARHLHPRAAARVCLSLQRRSSQVSSTTARCTGSRPAARPTPTRIAARTLPACARRRTRASRRARPAPLTVAL